MKFRITFILVVCSVWCHGQKKQNFPFEISTYKGNELSENAFLIRDGKDLVLIDALGSEDAAKQILQSIRGKKLKTIFITHGHPDHFLGLATILKEHPEAMVHVANSDIKKDIDSYVGFALSKGLLDGAPSMKPISSDPKGFDYQRIKILNSNRLEIGDRSFLTIETVSDAAESAHNTFLYNEKSNALFASDLLYNRVFNWLGSGVSQHGIDNWIATLQNLKSRFAKDGAVIYPGHGDVGDRTLFDANISYLKSFRNILCRTKNATDAKDFFNQLYPDYKGEFLLKRSIDHWIDSCSNNKSSISINHIQDLTHTLTPEFPYIPVPGITFPFEIKPIATMEKHGVRANQWTIHEHIGTQIDAPNHFAKDGMALDELNVKDLIVPVIVIDISEKSSVNADATLTLEDVKNWESKYGSVPDNACVMMYSGWEEFLYDKKYLGIDHSHNKHFPGISEEAIRFLITERKISGVGVDVISLDPGYDNEYKGHKLLSNAGKWAVEAVANLKKIPANGAWIFVGAPKVKGATGGITRIVAVWE